LTIGVVLVAAGFVAIFLAWNGAAGLDYVEGQVPYVLSGGLVGLGLIGAGLTVSIVQAHRRETEVLAAKLDELVEIVRGGAAPEATAPTGPTAVPDEAPVIAGRSTFHVPSCRIIAGSTGLQAMSRDAAVARGLSPCRVCKPAAA
jgi:hypothetical protein